MPPKWFYDSVGSDLFDQITRLPEYYPTRAEAQILRARAAEIAAASGADTLVELGSGTSEKTRMLLDALRDRGSLRRFVPFDVDASVLRAAGAAIEQEYPGIEIDAVCGDFEEHLGKIPDGRPATGGLPGFDDRQPDTRAARRFPGLGGRSSLQPGDALLLGTDLVKDTDRLVRAYDDSAGVTARFNRNVLAVVNRELGADFDVDAFEHVARWNADEERIEMWLRSTRAQQVRISGLDLDVDFADGEEMLTEVSCKFRRDGVDAELAAAGLRRTHWWTDEAGDFGLSLSVTHRWVSPRSPSDWRAARPPVAGVHVDSAACSRQSFAVIDAAAQHARHEAEVGGYVAAEAAAPVLDAGRAAVRALTGMSDADVVLHHRIQQRARHPARRLDRANAPLACLPGEYGPNLAIMARHGFEIRELPVDGFGRLDLDAVGAVLAVEPARAGALHRAGQPQRHRAARPRHRLRRAGPAVSR